jgi:hypothetical protein
MDHEAINNVRRKINEVLKKDDTKIVVGWRPSFSDKVEGDTWEDNNGKQWIMKNGIKQTVTKLDFAKTPWFCPECNRAMGHRFDSKFWRIRGMCMDCVIKKETKIKADGKWKEYEEGIIRANYVSNLQFINSDGEQILNIEQWNVDIPTVQKDIRDEITLLELRLSEALSGEAYAD